MSKLVEELKQEHASLVEVLEKVRTLGISSEDGQKLFLSAKEGLLLHLKKEDEQLYPSLRNAAENNEKLQRTLDTFFKDMETISTAALEFFNKYSRGGAGIEFAKDFGRLFATLGSRIRREENLLYPEYDKLNQ